MSQRTQRTRQSTTAKVCSAHAFLFQPWWQVSPYRNGKKTSWFINFEVRVWKYSCFWSIRRKWVGRGKRIIKKNNQRAKCRKLVSSSTEDLKGAHPGPHLQLIKWFSLKRKFLFNFKSNEEKMQFRREKPLNGASSGSDDELPSGWESRTTDKGQVFFINHSTQKTTWSHPKSVKKKRVWSTIASGRHCEMIADGSKLYVQ